MPPWKVNPVVANTIQFYLLLEQRKKEALVKAKGTPEKSTDEGIKKTERTEDVRNVIEDYQQRNTAEANRETRNVVNLETANAANLVVVVLASLLDLASPLDLESLLDLVNLHGLASLIDLANHLMENVEIVEEEAQSIVQKARKKESKMVLNIVVEEVDPKSSGIVEVSL